MRYRFAVEEISPNGKKSVFWWNSEIKSARVECVPRRRLFLRARRRGEDIVSTMVKEEYGSARQELKASGEHPLG